MVKFDLFTRQQGQPKNPTVRFRRVLWNARDVCVLSKDKYFSFEMSIYSFE